jgi:glutathione S-transferase
VDARDKRGHDEQSVSEQRLTPMTLKLFELVGTDAARPFSPFCWRTRMALAHKGLGAESIPWCFTEKQAIAPHRSEKVPVLIDGETSVADSWAIANYLEDNYPDRPSLFGGEGGRAVGRMINWWGDVTVVGGMFPLIVADIPSHLKPVDAAYFRQTREARFGKPLEEVVAARDTSVEGFRRALDPLRLTLRTQPFLGGEAPNYADYIVFGAFQWARVVSPFKLLAENDPVYAWREKLLDAFDGMARKSPGYDV